LIDGVNIDTGCIAWSVKYSNPFAAANEAIDLITEIRVVLKDDPVIAYDGGPDWDGADPDDPTSFPYLVVVCGTKDQFDILRVEQTDGINYGHMTEDIINFLQELDQEFGVDIIGADSTGVRFIVKHIPKGIEANKLRERLLEFAPDIEDDSLTNGFVPLWWD
jgi:hypothetical protein